MTEIVKYVNYCAPNTILTISRLPNPLGIAAWLPESNTMDKISNIESLETFSNVCEEILDNLFTTRQTCNLEPHIIQAAKESIQKIIIDNNFEVNQIWNCLTNSGWSEDKVKCFLSHLEKKKSEILYAMLINHNSKCGDTITDFDWFLKFVKGTDELKTLSYPLLQLVLSTTNSSGELKNSSFDIQKDMLKKLIDLLENIDDTCQ